MLEYQGEVITLPVNSLSYCLATNEQAHIWYLLCASIGFLGGGGSRYNIKSLLANVGFQRAGELLWARLAEKPLHQKWGLQEDSVAHGDVGGILGGEVM